MRPHHTVYASARDGRLDTPIVDGDVVVVAIDWTTFDPEGDAHVILARAGVGYGLPGGLIRAAVADISLMADADLGGHLPIPGPDRPWVYVAFAGRMGLVTCAGNGATVVSHDWSFPEETRSAASLAAFVADLGRLGAAGRAAALERSLVFLRADGADAELDALVG